ncbi:MAG: IS630 family transposase [Planctomycetes bacterium]|nr:IS630 family transposase [Planctomycetota bacterium]MBX3469496.1 IS630 family transposase [Planctomycetota bacterium]MBX3472602.1 IS630 family transposase [Planctomycetota bacterium]
MDVVWPGIPSCRSLRIKRLPTIAELGGHDRREHPMKLVIELRRHERRQLLKAMRKSTDPHYRVRCQAVLAYARGLGCNQVARALECAPSTAANAARRYLREGIHGLSDKRADNGAPKIDDDLLAALLELLAHAPGEYGWERPTWTRELLALTLREAGIAEVSVSTVARALERVGARWKVAKPVVACPWSKRRRNKRLREIAALLRRLPKHDVAAFSDEVDIHLNPKIGRDWSLRGRQPLVMTPGKNAKRYVAGAMDARTRKLVWVASDRKNSELFIALLWRLERAYPAAKRIHVVLDNYVIHSSKKTQAALAKLSGRIVLHFLPPYCPDANKIERLWGTLHANVTRNHRHKTIEALMAAVTRWLRLPVGQRTAEGRARQVAKNMRRAHAARRHRRFVAA